MTRVLKTFLLWLLIAAMPIQGLAAVVKASCGPLHHGMSSVMVKSIEHHHHDDAGSISHHHESSGAGNSTSPDSDIALADTATDTKHIHKTSYCSACAACCVGATAPPADITSTPAFSSVEAAVNPPVISYAGFIPAGLERPPRHLSA